MIVTRREFFEGLGAGTVVLGLQACGGGGDSGTSGGPGFGGGCSATSITPSHGHALTVPTADLTSTTSMSYSIRGTADHDHKVMLTAQNLQDLKNNLSVTVTSSSTTTVAYGAHAHIVPIHC